MRLHKLNFKRPSSKVLVPILIFIFSVTFAVKTAARPKTETVAATDPYLTCTDIKFIYARGSGSDLNSERDYQPFESAITETFQNSGKTFSFYELGTKPGGYSGKSYPAPGIGVQTWQRFTTSLGALITSGEAYRYGNSVEDGADEATGFILNMRSVCPNTKLVLAGYSQGAQVVSRTLQKIKPSMIEMALTFGDPKLYLPEGKRNLLTNTTSACRDGKSVFSVYRAYVPDCYTYEGILGGYTPYQPSSDYDGKLKAYCQFHDVICSAYVDLNDLAYGHASYDEQGTYLRAAQDVYHKIFPDSPKPAATQNVAIMIDFTWSMSPLIASFQADAVATANRVFKNGGKVALYAFGDLGETETPVELCNFETCSSENISQLIYDIRMHNGGDEPESFLSGAYQLMHRLNWDAGANKSIVVLTDAPYLNPDRDGVTESDVLALSYEIDPVNFYIITKNTVMKDYEEFARLTGGAVYSSANLGSFLEIEEAYTSHEPTDDYSDYLSTLELNSATLNNLSLEKTSDTSLHLSFDTDAKYVVLTLNDFVLGYLDTTEAELTDLDFSEDTTVCLSPISDSGLRTEAVCETLVRSTTTGSTDPENSPKIPRAPNTGRR